MERKLIQEYEVSSWERVEFQADEGLKEIEKKIAQDPDNAELWMEKGLKLAESALYREAGECYAHAISLDPFNGILYRHRAHRFLSQWRFEDARADFVIASRLIPENWDVWYHLGLSNFLLGDYAKAEAAYQRCLELSQAEDELIAVCDWDYMTELRLGNREKAQALLENIKEDFNPGDNTAYFRRLLMYKGILKPEEVIPEDISKMQCLEVVTMGFGISNYYWYNGDKEKSNQMIDMILDMGDKNDCYFAFGYLAAKVDKKNRG